MNHDGMTSWRFERTHPCVSGSGSRTAHATYLSIVPAPDATVVCAFCGLPPYERMGTLTVRAAVWFDARTVARNYFHTTELHEERVPDYAPVDRIVRWDGADSGARPNKRMVVAEV